MGLIEKYGSGIKRIIGYFRDAGSPLPEFRNVPDGFMVTVFAADFRKMLRLAGCDKEGVELAKKWLKKIAA